MSEADDTLKTQLLKGYRGHALELLKSVGAKSGSKVKIKTNDGLEATGLLIPRYENESSDNVVLKLKSGYNIGINADSISEITILEDPLSSTSSVPPKADAVHKQEKSVLLLSTGGTIASRVDYRTGAVRPAFTASDLYSTIPELGEIADIKCEVIFSTFSENLAQEHWKELSERIAGESQKKGKSDGIVVMLGTDTMAYVSAALSFSLLGFDLPVVCVGAQRSSDRPSADSALNLKGAVRFAGYSRTRGVFIAMHKNESDEVIAIHHGVRVRKNHTSKRNAFESIDVPHYAEIRNDVISYAKDYPLNSKFPGEKFARKTNFDPKVSLVKFYPGFDPAVLQYLARQEKLKGIIIEGTGLGHVSSKTVAAIGELIKNGIYVGIASQCIWGRVDLNVYETGIDLLNAGVIPVGNMLSETAYVKLSWAIGNFPIDLVKTIMTENLAGELTGRTGLSRLA